jgi:cyclopropane-fatty-acyl-phospholipid synthase
MNGVGARGSVIEETDYRPAVRAREASRSRRAGPPGAGVVSLGMLTPLGRATTSAPRRLLASLGSRVEGGTMVVEEQWTGGGTFHIGVGEPAVRLEVHDRRTYAAVLGRGSVGLGESYVAGWWDADDLTVLVRVLLRLSTRPRRMLDTLGRSASAPMSALARLFAPDKRRDRRNVQAHYDLPGELFDLMLDETMAYSCAVFDEPDMTLADAQRAKFDRLCRKLQLRPEDHLLEIGTGWGGLAIHAATHYGCRVTTTTVSDAQREIASKAAAAAGLSERITVLGLDYRELGGSFDKLVSVEMIEAVDWRRHDTFFSVCSRLLRPDGLMALQAITIADQSYERAKHHDDFIRAMIFPGGCIPSVEAITRSVTAATDLIVLDVEDIGRHYAETLRRWRQNVHTNLERLRQAGFDRGFERLWSLYLSYCEGAFLEGHISDVQVVLAKPAWRKELSVRAL